MKLGDSTLVVRKAEPGDTSFLLSTWLRSAKDITRMTKDDFFSFTRPQVEADLKNGTVLVACDQAEPGTICGWVCYRDGVERWGYTVYKLRNHGIHTFLKDFAEARR